MRQKVLVGPNHYRYLDLPDTECQHLGAPSGEMVSCPACEGRTALKVFSCAKHGRCTRGGTPVVGVACCVGCPDHTGTVGPERVTRLALGDGSFASAFNPGLVELPGGGLRLVWRQNIAGGRLAVCDLTGPDYQPGPSTPLSLDHYLCRAGQEDGRLFWHHDRLHLAFSGVQLIGKETAVQVMLARFTSDLRTIEQVWYPDYGKRQPWEKNWVWFDHAGTLYAVHTIAPIHRVLCVAGGTATVASEASWRPPWLAGLLRGGAPAVLVGDEYYAWFHGWQRHQRGQVGWSYSVGVYTFEAKPPFRPLRCTARPLLVPDENIRFPNTTYSVVFPLGAVRRAGRWLVSYGHQDRYCEIAELDALEVDKVLVRVR